MLTATIEHLESELCKVHHVVSAQVKESSGFLTITVKTSISKITRGYRLEIYRVVNSNIPVGVPMSIKIEMSYRAKLVNKLTNIFRGLLNAIYQ